MALLGATGAGLLLWSLPVGLVETVVASSGLSEALPAAAPPLGMKGRLIVAAFGAVMALGLIGAGYRDRRVVLLTHRKEEREEGAPGVSKMGFALSKLNWLGRNRGEAPARRRADAHPDAPARSPIFASRDFGGLDIFARTAPGRDALHETAGEEPAASLPIPGAADAMAVETAFARLHRTVADDPVEADHEEVAKAAPLRSETLSLAELTDRLERGLVERKRLGRPASVLADMPVERAVPVRDHVEENVDEALRAALGTLRSMAGHRR